MAAAMSSPTIGRRSRQSVEEELWLLRSRQFVKSESLRLNSLSPRSSHNCSGCSDDNNNRTTRRWRRRRGVGHSNNHNFIEGMRDAARKARVFQLRISGRRSWWPSIPTARIDADRCISQQRQRDGTELNLISNSNQFDKRRKNFERPNKENESIPKKKFEWNNIWKRKNRSNNESDAEVGVSTSIDESTVVDTSMNTTTYDEVVDEGTEIEELAEDNLGKDGEGKKKKKKNRQNVVVAAVATTSVSSLGVALAILLL